MIHIFLFACTFSKVLNRQELLLYIGVDDTRVSDSTVYYTAQKINFSIKDFFIFLCSNSIRNFAFHSSFRICEW